MGNTQTADGKISKGGKVKGFMKIKGKKGKKFIKLIFLYHYLGKLH